MAGTLEGEWAVPAASSSASESPMSSSSCDNHQPVRKVISINGEEVDSSDMDHINIHDFATFKEEEVMTCRFFANIRRRQGLEAGHEGGSPDAVAKPLRRQLSFKKVAREVVQKENVLLALKHYSHRSDSSESEGEDGDEAARSRSSAGSVFVPAGGDVPQGISASNHRRLSAAYIVTTQRLLSKPEDLDVVDPPALPVNNNDIPPPSPYDMSPVQNTPSKLDLACPELSPNGVELVKGTEGGSGKAGIDLGPAYGPSVGPPPYARGAPSDKRSVLCAFCPCPCVVL